MKFYRVSIDEGKRKRYAWAFPPFGIPDKLVKCTICGREWYDCTDVYEKNLSFPITFTNNYFADFLSCQGDKLVNQAVKDFIEKYKIRSAKFIRMPVVSKSEFTKEQIKELREDGYNVNKFHDEKPVYYRLSAEVGANLHQDSNVIWMDSGEERCKHCGYGVGYKQKDYFAPYFIELSSWNGYDLFKVREFGLTLFCTEKLKIMCEDVGFCGIEFDEIIAK